MSLEESKNYDYCKKAIALKGNIEVQFLGLGKMLHEIKEKRMYEAGWESWDEYEMEFKLAPSTLSKLMKVYQRFVVEFEIPPREIADVGGWTLVSDILPVVKSKQDAVKWLKVAENSTRSDLKKTLKEAKTGVDMNNCSHKNTYTVEICRDCGERWSNHK